MWRRVIPPRLVRGHVRQRTHARVGVEHVVARQPRARDHARGLPQQVVDLLGLGHHAVEIALVHRVGRADEVELVPGDDEVRATVLEGLHVQCPLGRAGEALDHEVAALRAADEPLRRAPSRAQQAVDPRTGDVDRDRRARLTALPADEVADLHAPAHVVLHEQTLGLRVRQHDRAGVAGRQRVLHRQALGELDLRVVVDGGAAQAVRVEPPAGGPAPRRGSACDGGRRSCRRTRRRRPPCPGGSGGGPACPSS